MTQAAAINNFVKILKKDKEWREAFKANIAMAFYDNYYWHKKKTGKRAMSSHDVHAIGNNGAEYFLKLLCDEIKIAKGNVVRVAHVA